MLPIWRTICPLGWPPAGRGLNWVPAVWNYWQRHL